MTELAPPALARAPLAPWVDWAGLAGLAFIWGSSFAATKIATATLAPTWLVALRMVFAAATLAILVLAMRQKLPGFSGPGRQLWTAYGAIGVIGMALPFNFFAWGAPRVDSALLGIINGASPLFTALLAAMWLRGERLSAHRAAGVGLGFLGLMALAGPALLGAFGASGAWAVVAATLGAFFYGVSNVATRGAPAIDPVTGAFIMCLASAVAALAAALVQGPPPAAIAPEALAVAIALGIFPTGLATVVYVFLVRRRGPMFVAYVMYLSPLWATGMGVAAMHERPGPAAAVALGLILAGVYVGNRERRAQP